MKFNGYVFTILSKEDVPFFLKHGMTYPPDYTPTGFGVGNGKGSGSLYILADAPNVPHNQRVYVEAVKTGTGFCMRRWVEGAN